jgi:hypothetical protein
LRASGKGWDAGRREAAAARLQPGLYQSPVSQNLITSFSQGQGQIAWVSLLIVMWGLRNYDLKRRRE